MPDTNSPLYPFREKLREAYRDGIDKTLLVWKIDHGTELSLSELGPGEVGDTLALSILFNGPRYSFNTIYGIPVEWDAEKLELAARK